MSVVKILVGYLVHDASMCLRAAGDGLDSAPAASDCFCPLMKPTRRAPGHKSLDYRA